jgi:NADPH-dependent 2,4-dienoyl-CoA reductase/sulfur reductase-like enzyme
MSARSFDCDVAIIGAGPAGLSAATAASESGARTLVIDAYVEAGGQYWMQAADSRPIGPQAAEGRVAIRRAEAAGVRFLKGAEVFAAYPGFKLFANGRDGAAHVACRTVIVASGAHDRTMAFPGWTLPGVMTAGGGQRLAKTQGVLPGKHIVLSGSGIFLYAVADTLIDKGAEIVALVEARRPDGAVVRQLARFPERWHEAAALFGRVRKRVPRRMNGRVVVEALGKERVETVSVARLDGSGARTIDGIDCLLTSYGFQPQIEVTSLLGCTHCFDDGLGGWHVEADPVTGRTSVDGVFAAGEVTGVAGAKPAQLSGSLAGYAAARALGLAVRPEATMPLVRQLARGRAFGHSLGRIFAPLPELSRLAKDDTVLCRCEEVTLGEVRAAVAEGAASLYGSKIWTRAGMGRCQGRICRMPMTMALAAATGRPASEIGYNQTRVPARPVPIDAVLGALTAR